MRSTNRHSFIRSLKRKGFKAEIAIKSDCTTSSYPRPRDPIRATAKREVADLIVMETHGRTGLGHVMLGSVVQRVVRFVPCPVLTVKAPESESDGFGH